jgi:peptidoglycan hydrolase-like protein with peptidoglycan-binding domain
MNENTIDETEAAAEVEVADVGQPKPRAKSKPVSEPETFADPDLSSHDQVAREPEAELAAAEPELQPQSSDETETIEVVAGSPEMYPYAVTGDRDDIYLEHCIVKNAANRKSLTVHHLQRRLYELGYKSASKDRDGYYGNNTIEAVAAWQAASNIEATGVIDAESFKKIFTGDNIVVAHI